MVEIAAKQGESSKLKTKKEKAATALGNIAKTAFHKPGSSSVASARPTKIAMVLTIASLATKPEKAAATACQLLKPRGAKIGAKVLPITAIKLCSKNSTKKL